MNSLPKVAFYFMFKKKGRRGNIASQGALENKSCVRFFPIVETINKRRMDSGIQSHFVVEKEWFSKLKETVFKGIAPKKVLSAWKVTSSLSSSLYSFLPALFSPYVFPSLCFFLPFFHLFERQRDRYRWWQIFHRWFCFPKVYHAWGRGKPGSQDPCRKWTLKDRAPFALSQHRLAGTGSTEWLQEPGTLIWDENIPGGDFSHSVTWPSSTRHLLKEHACLCPFFTY